MSIADELEKLAQLRERGVLTAHEFQLQKERLLDSPDHASTKFPAMRDIVLEIAEPLSRSEHRMRLTPPERGGEELARLLNIPPSETWLVFYDTTFGSNGKDGVVLTERAIYFRNSFMWIGYSGARSLEYAELDVATLRDAGTSIEIGPQRSIGTGMVTASPLATLLTGIRDRVRKIAYDEIAAKSSPRSSSAFDSAREIAALSDRTLPTGNVEDSGREPTALPKSKSGNLPHEPDSGVARSASPERSLAALLVRRVKIGLWAGFALIFIIAVILTLTNTRPDQARSGRIERQNGEIPGFSECLTAPSMFQRCCDQVGGMYLPNGTSGRSSFPTCVR